MNSKIINLPPPTPPPSGRPRRSVLCDPSGYGRRTVGNCVWPLKSRTNAQSGLTDLNARRAGLKVYRRKSLIYCLRKHDHSFGEREALAKLLFDKAKLLLASSDQSRGPGARVEFKNTMGLEPGIKVKQSGIIWEA